MARLDPNLEAFYSPATRLPCWLNRGGINGVTRVDGRPVLLIFFNVRRAATASVSVQWRPRKQSRYDANELRETGRYTWYRPCVAADPSP
jgi:hypothetical protein